MSDATKMVLAVETDRAMELSRRIGYAKGSIEEALQLIGENYWAEKSLRRALSELSGSTYAGEARQ